MSAAVTVRVPGSTSNLGAGFDCVGIAIDRWIRVAARREESRAAPITIERRGALAGPTLPAEGDLLYQGFRSACPAAGREPRSEEHTSEIQSLAYLVCPLLP